MSEAERHVETSRATLSVIEAMEAALGAGSNDMQAHFHEDFLWRGNAVENGRIKDNPVSVDFASVLALLGHDVFAGNGCEAYDRGEKTPAHP